MGGRQNSGQCCSVTPCKLTTIQASIVQDESAGCVCLLLQMRYSTPGVFLLIKYTLRCKVTQLVRDRGRKHMQTKSHTVLPLTAPYVKSGQGQSSCLAPQMDVVLQVPNYGLVSCACLLQMTDSLLQHGQACECMRKPTAPLLTMLCCLQYDVAVWQGYMWKAPWCIETICEAHNVQSSTNTTVATPQCACHVPRSCCSRL